MSELKVEIISDTETDQCKYKILKDNVMVGGNLQLTRDEFGLLTYSVQHIAELLTKSLKGECVSFETDVSK